MLIQLLLQNPSNWLGHCCTISKHISIIPKLISPWWNCQGRPGWNTRIWQQPYKTTAYWLEREWPWQCKNYLVRSEYWVICGKTPRSKFCLRSCFNMWLNQQFMMTHMPVLMSWSECVYISSHPSGLVGHELHKKKVITYIWIYEEHENLNTLKYIVGLFGPSGIQMALSTSLKDWDALTNLDKLGVAFVWYCNANLRCHSMEHWEVSWNFEVGRWCGGMVCTLLYSPRYCIKDAGDYPFGIW
jgi:hypothetical protein